MRRVGRRVALGLIEQTHAPLVMIAEVLGVTLNSSAAYLSTAVNGAASGTDKTRNGSFGSLARVILKDTLATEEEDMMVVWVSRARAPKSEEYVERRVWYDECRDGNETTMNECYCIREIMND